MPMHVADDESVRGVLRRALTRDVACGAVTVATVAAVIAVVVRRTRR
jgi:hypothetical protein